MTKTGVVIAGALLAGALLLYVKKNGVAGTVAVDAGAVVGQAVVDAGAGVVLGIGDGLGVPRTSMTECERARAEGRTWDASFACPARDFLSYLFN